MKSKDLLTIWGAPDNTQLTAKQYTIRLPILVAAQISALCEMYPKKNRTELIGDLLATALEEVKEALPIYEGKEFEGLGPDGEPGHEMYGPRVTFDSLVAKYTRELEAEHGEEQRSLKPESTPVRKGKPVRSQKRKG